MPKYHEVADKTMDHLLESLEELHEVESLEGYEVEFHVCDLSTNLISRQLTFLTLFSAEWSPHTQIGFLWNLRRQQTTSE
jgi:frataxin-like iron-binding protein CyaY